MGLFSPAWESGNEKKALNWVHNCRKPDRLAEAAAAAPSAAVRIAAAEKLIWEYGSVPLSPEILRLLALRSGNGEICLKALNRLEKQEDIAAVAMESASPPVQTAAVNRLSDTDAVLRVALESGNASAREAAAKKLEDEELLTRIAVREKDMNVWTGVMDRIRGEEALTRIAREAPTNAQRLDAAERIPNGPELLQEVAGRLSFPELVKHFGKMAEKGDPRAADILVRFLREHRDVPEARSAAISLRELYFKALHNGDAELRRRIAPLRGEYFGGHTDRHFQDCGYGDHNDSPGYRLDLPGGGRD